MASTALNQLPTTLKLSQLWLACCAYFKTEVYCQGQSEEKTELLTS